MAPSAKKFRIKSSLIKLNKKILPFNKQNKIVGICRFKNNKLNQFSQDKPIKSKKLSSCNQLYTDKRLIPKISVNPSFITQLKKKKKPMRNDSSPWHINSKNS